MAVSNYGKVDSGRYKRRKKIIVTCCVIALAIVAAAGVIGVLTSKGEGYQQRVSLVQENNDLKAQVSQLQEALDAANSQISELQGQVQEQSEYIASVPVPTETPSGAARTTPQPETGNLR